MGCGRRCRFLERCACHGCPASVSATIDPARKAAIPLARPHHHASKLLDPRRALARPHHHESKLLDPRCALARPQHAVNLSTPGEQTAGSPPRHARIHHLHQEAFKQLLVISNVRVSPEAFLAHQVSPCTGPPSTKRYARSLCSSQTSEVERESERTGERERARERDGVIQCAAGIQQFALVVVRPG